MLALVFAAASFATIWSAQWASPTDATAAAAGAAPPAYTLLQLNLRYDNPDHAAVLSLIGRRRPDIITLNEVSQAWVEALERIREAYPHRIVCPFPTSSGAPPSCRVGPSWRASSRCASTAVRWRWRRSTSVAAASTLRRCI